MIQALVCLSHTCAPFLHCLFESRIWSFHGSLSPGSVCLHSNWPNGASSLVLPICRERAMVLPRTQLPYKKLQHAATLCPSMVPLTATAFCGQSIQVSSVSLVCNPCTSGNGAATTIVVTIARNELSREKCIFEGLNDVVAFGDLRQRY